ncbi:hypothetical protein [Flavobacterium sp. Sd200]|uniref:hypothetical protein n=1 Tax=Flavobacterium sp. Sd200 TaxID=2692211 RepID=UPI001F18E423|nr:hypothetical protein [Flavobacterium sp. Sd200]
MVKMLSNFFNHKDLFAVYVRTKVIHNLFEANKDLDVHKLELFHVQYTSSLTDLFQKLKKAKEQQYLLMEDEVHINTDLIDKLQKESEQRNFIGECRSHGRQMGVALKQLYTMLAENSQAMFSWNDITQFSVKFASEYYREIPEADFAELTAVTDKNVYQNNYVAIERKLLGRLNILNFRVKFVCGLSHNNQYAEVFDFIDSNDRFVFINGSKSFCFLNEEVAKGIDLSKNTSNKADIITGLQHKNDMLRDRQAALKTALPQDVEAVLATYLEKISGVDFLEELQNVDEQTNILRAMLNININSK